MISPRLLQTLLNSHLNVKLSSLLHNSLGIYCMECCELGEEERWDQEVTPYQNGFGSLLHSSLALLIHTQRSLYWCFVFPWCCKRKEVIFSFVFFSISAWIWETHSERDLGYNWRSITENRRKNFVMKQTCFGIVEFRSRSLILS
jgi:hypothetical protein